MTPGYRLRTPGRPPEIRDGRRSGGKRDAVSVALSRDKREGFAEQSLGVHSGARSLNQTVGSLSVDFDPGLLRDPGGGSRATADDIHWLPTIATGDGRNIMVHLRKRNNKCRNRCSPRKLY